MKVGVCSTNNIPFVIRDGNKYSGISIEIWETIAKKLNYKFEYVEIENDQTEAINKLNSKIVDILVGPYIISEKNYQHVNFTIPYYYGDLALASLRKTNNLENYLNIFKVIGSIISLFIIILFINKFITNFNINNNFADYIINSIPTFNDRKMYFLYAIIFLSIVVIYIDTFKPNLNLKPKGQSIKNKKVLYYIEKNNIQNLFEKNNVKGIKIQIKNTSDHQKQIQENQLFNNYIRKKNSIYGIVDDSSKIAYVLNHNINKYNGIRIIESGLINYLYAFILPKNSKHLDDINSKLREAQKEKINQLIVKKYLGTKYENMVTF